MMHHRQLGLAAAIAAALVGLTGAVALMTRAVAAEEARAVLGFTFAGLDRRPAEVLAVLSNNARVMATILVLAVAAQVTATRRRGHAAIGGSVVRVACDAAVLAGCAIHVLLVGSAIGGYGRRTLALIAVHGPFELASFSLALSLYVLGRRGDLRLVTGWRVAGAAVMTLALAALLEVYA